MTLPWDSFAPASLTADDTIIIIGAGLAGCWLASLLTDAGQRVIVLEQGEDTAAGASGNPGGIVKPHVTRQPSAPARFYIDAHAYLLHKLSDGSTGKACAFRQCGVLQAVHNNYPSADTYTLASAQQGTHLAGTRVNSGSLYFNDSGWLSPSALCRHLINQSPHIDLRTRQRVCQLKPYTGADGQSGWLLTCQQGNEHFARHVVIANGAALQQFTQTEHYPIVPARGQLSRFRLKPDSHPLRCVVSGKTYVIPDGESVLVGASFTRHDTDTDIRAPDHSANLLGLNQLLPELAVWPEAVEGYTGIRATTPDRLPLLGPVADHHAVNQAYRDLHHGKPARHYPALPVLPGLYVMGGFGSRGIVATPFAAKLLAGYLLGKQSEQTLSDYARWCNPARFQIRALKRRYT